jgi:hypothetical protein
MKFSVSVPYIPNRSTQICQMDTSKECADQFRIKLCFNDFWQRYAPLTLKIIRNFSFPYVIFPTAVHMFNSNWRMDSSKKFAGQVRIWSLFDDFCQSYAPWTFKLMRNVSFPNSCTQSTQIWHMDTLKECEGQNRIWSFFDDLCQSYAPWFF